MGETGDMMIPAQADPWMAYIQSEVVAACAAKGWGHQIRRREEAREKPVAASVITDYEWKLVPDPGSRPTDGGFEGTYYVLRLKAPGVFEFVHDNFKAGAMDNLGWLTFTATEFAHPTAYVTPPARPPQGWLARLLDHLARRFGPNTFSYT